MMDQAIELTRSKKKIHRWIEVTLLSIGLPASAWLLNMSDPFFLKAAFPWIITPPLLASLRYGSRCGFYSLLLLAVLSRTYLWTQGIETDHNWFELWAGGLFVCLAAGELAGHWKQHYLTEKHRAEAMQSEVTNIEQKIQLLQISHTQLEVESMGSNRSLWRSLKLLEDEIPAGQASLERLPSLAKKMMQILKTYEWLEVAAFYAISSRGKLCQQPLARTGNMIALTPQDYLLQQVLETGRPISLNRNSSLAGSYQELGTSLLAAFPIVDKQQTVHLVLAVQQINFLAFEPKNLNLLATLCAWLSARLEDATAHQALIPTNLSPLYNQWKTTEKEVHSALELVACHHKSTLLVGFNIENSADKENYLTHFAENMRGGNHCWRVERESDTVLILLLPMLDGESFGMLHRKLENDFYRRFNQTFTQAGVLFYSQYFHRYQHRQELVGYLDLLRQPHYALATA
ncbi:MAG: PelD GGDEF domain-containing protein [Thiothrix sp.]|uniref:PelD GGDEF domain-containing protein n=1 Tax=Thiothrix sp. TaxID=1032 RepID=UPI0026271D6F|nr:PelD GGDEF domain-containing protein [Thiothrix sp.]MDD5392668.1 PelD GGDEF domain-containing protein [Thiothrix sp.]